jgi:hypothetical protein
MADKRIIELTNEKLTLGDGDYTIVDSNEGTYKYKLKRIVDSIPAPDTTLSIAGRAADAKATGDEIAGVKSDLGTLTGSLCQDVPLAGLGEFVNQRWTGTAWTGNDQIASNKTPLYLPFDVYIKPNTGYRLKVLTWTSAGVYIGGNESWKTTQQKAVAGSYITLSLANASGSGNVSVSDAYTFFHASLFEENINELKSKVPYVYGSIPNTITSCDDIATNSIYMIGTSSGQPAVSDAPIYPCYIQTIVNGNIRFQICYSLDSSNTYKHVYRNRLNNGTWMPWKTIAISSDLNTLETSIKAGVAFNYGSIPNTITSCDDVEISSIYFIGRSGGQLVVSDAPFVGFLQTIILLFVKVELQEKRFKSWLVSPSHLCYMK